MSIMMRCLVDAES